MDHTCKNCGHSFTGNYCNECGQSGHTHKLNFHFLWHDIQHGFFHVDKGILYSIYQLYTRPGHTVRDFIEGKRVKHFKPLSMVVILATIYGLLSIYFDIHNAETIKISAGGEATAEEMSFYTNLLNWFRTHYALTTLIALPFYALGSYVAFKKQGYNYIEHIVLNAFLSAQQLALHIAVFPLIYYFNKTEELTVFVGILRLVDLVLTMWVYAQFFNRMSTIKAILFTLLAYLIYMISLFIVGGLTLTILSASMQIH